MREWDGAGGPDPLARKGGISSDNYLQGNPISYSYATAHAAMQST